LDELMGVVSCFFSSTAKTADAINSIKKTEYFIALCSGGLGPSQISV
jgi:hypothetical protein